jgi:hypothetical protein
MKNIFYGPVFISNGSQKGRIGFCDDSKTKDNDEEVGIVYFGDPLLASGYHLIKCEDMSHITTHNLIERQNIIQNQLSSYSENSLKGKDRVAPLEELEFINNLLADRIFEARLIESEGKSNIFISHSSKDKQFARLLCIDLKKAGHNVWLDEWAILVGESIPKKIEIGVEECNFVVVVLSKKSVKSNWVEREWHLKYWEEVKKGAIFVLPVLKEKCKIPSLLKTKRYADFTADYSQGLEDLMVAINKLNNSG